MSIDMCLFLVLFSAKPDGLYTSSCTLSPKNLRDHLMMKERVLFELDILITSLECLDYSDADKSYERLSADIEIQR